MARQILRIRDLGQSTFWQLMQMEGQPAPLTGKTALLLAADGADTQDVLAATAAARQLAWTWTCCRPRSGPRTWPPVTFRPRFTPMPGSA